MKADAITDPKDFKGWGVEGLKGGVQHIVLGETLGKGGGGGDLHLRNTKWKTKNGGRKNQSKVTKNQQLIRLPFTEKNKRSRRKDS